MSIKLLINYNTARTSQVVLLVKNQAANGGYVTDGGSIPGSGRSSGGGHGNTLSPSCLENSIDRSLAGNSPWGHTQPDAGAQLTLLILEESKFGVSLLYRNCPDSLQSIKYGGLFIFREVCETI